jgi:hypothetical protein
VGEALLYEAILTVAQLTSLHSLLPTALQHIRHHSFSYPANVLDPKPDFWETQICSQNLVFERPKFEAKTWFFRDQNSFSYPANVLDPKPGFLESKIDFHTQLIFWIQSLVFRDQNVFFYPANVLDPKPGFWETNIYVHTQLMFWIQNLVFERPKFISHPANVWDTIPGFLRDQNLFSCPANVSSLDIPLQTCYFLYFLVVLFLLEIQIRWPNWIQI